MGITDTLFPAFRTKRSFPQGLTIPSSGRIRETDCRPRYLPAKLHKRAEPQTAMVDTKTTTKGSQSKCIIYFPKSERRTVSLRWHRHAALQLGGAPAATGFN
jgi:hypothetical protein